MAARPKPFVVILLVLALAAVVALSLDPGESRSAHGMPTERVVIGGEKFDLEIASDPTSRAKGLMYRTSIEDHGGMLFVFPDAEVREQSFWMKNCLVDMDILYLTPNGQVTATHRMAAQPARRRDETDAAYETRIRRSASYPSVAPAQFAIELKAGTIDRLGVKPGDTIALKFDRLKAKARQADDFWCGAQLHVAVIIPRAWLPAGSSSFATIVTRPMCVVPLDSRFR